MPLRPNLIAYGCALAFVASVGIVLFVNFQPNPGLEHRDLGAVALLWLCAFVLPPFLVGLRAKERGVRYGLIVGMVPLVIAASIGYRGPAFVALLFYVLAPLGGLLGQTVAGFRRAG